MHIIPVTLGMFVFVKKGDNPGLHSCRYKVYKAIVSFLFLGYFCSTHTLCTSTTFATYFPDITENTYAQFKFPCKSIVSRQPTEDNFV